MWRLVVPGYVYFARGQVWLGIFAVCCQLVVGCAFFPLGLLIVPLANILDDVD